MKKQRIIELAVKVIVAAAHGIIDGTGYDQLYGTSAVLTPPHRRVYRREGWQRAANPL